MRNVHGNSFMKLKVNLKIHPLGSISILFFIASVLFITFGASSSLAQATSRFPKEAENWVAVTGTTDNGDRDGIMVIFFEIPDTMTSTLYFTVNDPGNDGVYPDEFGPGTTLFYLIGGSGTLSDNNSRLIDYSSDRLLARTGNTLSSFSRSGGNEGWVYFSGVSPSQGEHIGNKYYFKIVADASSEPDKNAFQVDISYSGSGSPTGISGVRTFSYI